MLNMYHRTPFSPKSLEMGYFHLKAISVVHPKTLESEIKHKWRYAIRKI